MMIIQKVLPCFYLSTKLTMNRILWAGIGIMVKHVLLYDFLFAVFALATLLIMIINLIKFYNHITTSISQSATDIYCL